MNTKAEEAYNQGKEAYHDGKAPSSNPYSYSHENNMDWADGYYDAKQEGPPNNIKKHDYLDDYDDYIF